MNKLIILEGPDGTGKSTLAKRLAEHYNAPLFHCTASKKMFSALEDYHNNVMDFVAANLHNHNIILDRFWPSEEVYGKLFRVDSAYHIDAGYKLHQRVKDCNGLYIFCFSDTSEHRVIGHDDPAHKLTLNEHRRVVNGYQSLHARMVKQYQFVMDYDFERDGQNPEKISDFYLKIEQCLR